MDIEYKKETQLLEAFKDGKVCVVINSNDEYIDFVSFISKYSRDIYMLNNTIIERSNALSSTKFKQEKLFAYIETKTLGSVKDYICSRVLKIETEEPLKDLGYLVLNYEKELFYIDKVIKEIKFPKEFLDYIETIPSLKSIFDKEYGKDIRYVLLLKEFFVFNKIKELEKLEQENLEKKIIEIIKNKKII